MTPEQIKDAREALSSMDDYARMNTGVDAIGPRGVLERFISEAERTTAQDEVLTDERIEAIALEHESFGFGKAERKSKLSIHGFEPEGLREFARAIAAESRLAEIQRGVEKLQGYDKARILVAYADVLALLQPQGQADTSQKGD